MNVQHRLQQLKQLSSMQYWVIAQALIGLPLIGVALWHYGLKKLYPLCCQQSSVIPPDRFNHDDLKNALQLAHAVNIAAQHGPYRATCLMRSLFTCYLLKRQHIITQLRIGISQHSGFKAHAWVEYQNTVINDRADVANDFTIFQALPAMLNQVNSH